MEDSKLKQSKSTMMMANTAPKSTMELQKTKSVMISPSSMTKSRMRFKSRAKLKSTVSVVKSFITVNDTNDPSYTGLVLPYRVVCRQRYRRSGVEQRNQFIEEIKAHELLQLKALDGERVHRIFCDTILRPLKAKDIIKPTREQQMKIEEILRTTLTF